MAQDQIVHLVYLNSQGIRVERRVVPDRIWFGQTDWIDEPQWLLDAYDVDHGVLRCYPMHQIADFSPDTWQRVPYGREDTVAAR